LNRVAERYDAFMVESRDEPPDSVSLDIRDMRCQPLWDGERMSIERVTWSDGSTSRRSRDVVRAPDAVTIVLELDDGRLVMIQNARASVEEALWEFPAGARDDGESGEDAARRELEEEAGFHARHMAPIGAFYSTPGLTDERMTVWRADGLSHVGQRLESYEQIRVHRRSWGEIIDMVANGSIRDGKSIAALFLMQEYERTLERSG